MLPIASRIELTARGPSLRGRVWADPRFPAESGSLDLELLQASRRVAGSWWNEDEAPGADCPARSDRALDARVTPADPLCVLVLEELCVVEQHIGVLAIHRPEIQSRDLSWNCPVSAGSWSGMYAKIARSASIRNPTVGPGCMTRADMSLAPSIDHGSFGTLWNVSRAGISRRSIGKSGGEKERLIRSAEALHR